MSVSAETLFDKALEVLPSELQKLEAKGERFDAHVFVVSNAMVAPGFGMLVGALHKTGTPMKEARKEASRRRTLARASGGVIMACVMYEVSEFSRQISEGYGGAELLEWLSQPVTPHEFRVVAINGNDVRYQAVEITPRPLRGTTPLN